MKEEIKDLTKGSATILFSLAGSGITVTLTSIVIARSVGVREFGLYALILSVQSIVYVFASLGIGTALTKYVAEFGKKDPDVATELTKTGFAFMLTLSGVSCLTYVSLGSLIGNQLYNEPDMTALIPFSAIATASAAILNCVLGIAQGLQRMKLFAVLQLAAPILTLFTVLIVVPSIGVQGAFIAAFLSQIAVSIFGVFWINQSGFAFVRSRFGFRNSPLFRRLVHFSVPFVLSAVLVGPVYWLGSTELALVSGLDAVGYFAIAFLFYQVLSIVPQSIIVPLLPKVSELEAHSRSAAKEHVLASMTIASTILLPLALGIGLFAKSIIETFFGSSYAPASDTAYLMVTTSYFAALASIIGSMITGMGRLWVGFGLNAIWAAFFLCIVFSLVPLSGLAGIGIAYAGSYSLHLMVSLFVSRRVLLADFNEIYRSVLVAAFILLLGYVAVIRFEWNWQLRLLYLVAGSSFFLLLTWKRKLRIREAENPNPRNVE